MPIKQQNQPSTTTKPKPKHPKQPRINNNVQISKLPRRSLLGSL